MIKYTLAFACSSDGFIAKYSGDNPFEWTSLEDKKHLDNLIKNHKWPVSYTHLTLPTICSV